MRALGRTAAVHESIDPSDLRRTEFCTDFLERDGLREGMNYFPAPAVPCGLSDRMAGKELGGVPWKHYARTRPRCFLNSVSAAAAILIALLAPQQDLDVNSAKVPMA